MTDATQRPVRRALISVSDKNGIVEFAQALHSQGVEILSTGGTASLLIENMIPCLEVSKHTGFPEIMDGRVKTLHPKIHGGILGRRGIDDGVMKDNDIAPIDLVVVNLYPFEETVAKEDCTLEDAIENIDIGGPAMVRATAKNHAFVSIIVDPDDYQRVLEELQNNDGTVTDETRFDLAVKAFEHTSNYDGKIANYLGRVKPDGSMDEHPRTINLQFNKQQEMRYGENPHQHAAFYTEKNISDACIATAKQLQGKELSYNNIGDTDATIIYLMPTTTHTVLTRNLHLAASSHSIANLMLIQQKPLLSVSLLKLLLLPVSAAKPSMQSLRRKMFVYSNADNGRPLHQDWITNALMAVC